eukprot:NODE_638_length_2513_cov_27.628452_g546_i0.p1 GENE.NODE_638_length_2513_cov_27.628452_g546_i0~~NODE_638_length_2513_cov_27.628452_g546_i0.p1  ORF type:complete len:482 (+),score=116.25 NODE_638_length_2513_cov_27.628452_g546_i0:197-1642(+)
MVGGETMNELGLVCRRMSARLFLAGLSNPLHCYQIHPIGFSRRAAIPPPPVQKPRGWNEFVTSERQHRVTTEIPAPEGLIAVTFTDVKDSTKLWDSMPEVMAEALKLHNSRFRKALQQFNGYEVKTEGDSFMCTFYTARDAAKWCLHLQERLLSLPWPEALLQHKSACVGRDKSGVLIWRGLRVRMGFHVGIPNVQDDPVTGRKDYFGPVVNLAARVSGSARGGEVVISEAAKEEVEPHLQILGEPVIRSIGVKALKGISRAEELFQLLPRKLSTRKFDDDVLARRKSSASSLNEWWLSQQGSSLEDWEDHETETSNANNILWQNLTSALEAFNDQSIDTVREHFSAGDATLPRVVGKALLFARAQDGALEDLDRLLSGENVPRSVIRRLQHTFHGIREDEVNSNDDLDGEQTNEDLWRIPSYNSMIDEADDEDDDKDSVVSSGDEPSLNNTTPQSRSPTTGTRTKRSTTLGSMGMSAVWN